MALEEVVGPRGIDDCLELLLLLLLFAFELVLDARSCDALIDALCDGENAPALAAGDSAIFGDDIARFYLLSVSCFSFRLIFVIFVLVSLFFSSVWSISVKQHESQKSKPISDEKLSAC